MFPKKIQLHKYFIICFWKFMVYFNFYFYNLDDQIDSSQIIKCKMKKEYHIKLFVIEESMVVEGAWEISKPLWDVGFSTSDNFIKGSKDDIE
jgi:hypothetical protein